MISTAGIRDPQLRRVLDALIADNRRLKSRLDQLQSHEGGPMNFTLPATVRKATSTGSKEIPAVDEIADNIGGEGIDTLGAVKVEYADSSTVESLQPAEAGAETTAGKDLSVLAGRTMSKITDAGSLATKNTVDTADIENNAIEQSKIAAGAVDSTELASSAVTNAKIASGAVDSAELASNAVTNAKIAAGAVDTAEIATNAITNTHLTGGCVDTAELASNSVTAAKIPAGTIDTSELADGAVTNAKSAWRGGYTRGGTSNSVGELWSAVKEIQDEISGDYTINENITAPSET